MLFRTKLYLKVRSLELVLLITQDAEVLEVAQWEIGTAMVEEGTPI